MGCRALRPLGPILDGNHDVNTTEGRAFVTAWLRGGLTASWSRTRWAVRDNKARPRLGGVGVGGEGGPNAQTQQWRLFVTRISTGDGWN